MVDFNFKYSKQAEKFFKKHEDIRKKFKQAIYSLFIGNRIDIKRMQGTEDEIYRIRINDYRVIFKIEKGQIIIIETILAGNRGEIYKQFKKW